MSKQHQNRMFFAFISTTGVLLLTKLLGFAKQMVQAGTFGVSQITDIVGLASGMTAGLQDIIFHVLWSSFLPLYIHSRTRGEADAKRLTLDTFKAFLLIAAGITVLILVGALPLSRVLAPSYSADLSKCLAGYLRLHAPLLILSVCIALSGSLLYANERFFLYELRSVNQSIIFILAILLFQQYFGVQVLVGATWVCMIFNTLYLWFFARRYQRVQCEPGGNPFQNPDVKKLLRMAGPLLLGDSMTYISRQVDLILASGLTSGTVTALQYTDILSQFVELFIRSFCSMLFTYITIRISEGKHQQVAALTTRAVSILLLIFLPVSILSVLCVEDIVHAVYARGAFSDAAVYTTSRAFRGYAYMFVPLVFQELFSRFQYGYQDSRRPMVNSVIGILANIFLSILLCSKLGIFGITFATSISAAISGFLNAMSAKRHNPMLSFRPLLGLLPWMAVGGTLCILTVRWNMDHLASFSPIVRFLLATLTGGGVYFLATAPMLWRLVRNKESV